MFSVHLNTLDDYLLKRVVTKFNTLRTGTRFYRSCKGARDFVDSVKPVWPLPLLRYENDTRYIKRHSAVSQIRGSRNMRYEFCRVECLEVSKCKNDFFDTVVIPEMEAMGAVEMLDLMYNGREQLSKDEVKRILTATKPQAVGFWKNHFYATSALFKNVKNLHFHLLGGAEESQSYWATRKIFQLMKTRKTITWHSMRLPTKSILSFLENWLQGESTYSLKKLTFVQFETLSWVDMEEMLQHADIKDLMERNEVTKSILERKGGKDGKLQICIDDSGTMIDFWFH